MVSEVLNNANSFDKVERRSRRFRLAEQLVIVGGYGKKQFHKKLAHLSHLPQLSCGESLGYLGALSVDRSQKALILVHEERTDEARSAFCSLVCGHLIMTR